PRTTRAARYVGRGVHRAGVLGRAVRPAVRFLTARAASLDPGSLDDRRTGRLPGAARPSGLAASAARRELADVQPVVRVPVVFVHDRRSFSVVGAALATVLRARRAAAAARAWLAGSGIRRRRRGLHGAPNWGDLAA